ncbi:hypothetical protein KEM48_000846 [Puccinia striiformis f. sp. tritici PST-130]|uniref:Uncharacterized protein n=1 Tax=Puccinia striiformis f. sp. tritici PST-78 TaxID=1165861 RepID=A0A0L0VYC8_9BASI|nr:hypothetical protein KEM48_000846 [Puccinia striiformis f. sp. tritici PST-130]KNF04192.1 hypothetical protein PSTG_02544 [Puccinia striiformis f. sp. tritici PST-78]
MAQALLHLGSARHVQKSWELNQLNQQALESQQSEQDQIDAAIDAHQRQEDNTNATLGSQQRGTDHTWTSEMSRIDPSILDGSHFSSANHFNDTSHLETSTGLDQVEERTVLFDLNDRSGMGFGGNVDSSDSESGGEVTIDWSLWLSGESNLWMFDDHVEGIGGINSTTDEGRVNTSSPWYPFPNKEYLTATLMLGQLHNHLSRAMYHQLRVVLNICNLNLPHWDTIRRMQKKIRDMLNIKLIETQSVMGNKCFSLSLKDMIGHELANPYVNKYLEFYPHQTYGHNVHALYQSVKWREELPRQSRVQMVANSTKHFYIFEPVTIKERPQDIVVPIFFFKYQNQIFAKCITPKVTAYHLADGTEKAYVMVPANLGFNSELLVDTPVSSLDKLYLEIKMRDGSLFWDHMERHIVGNDGKTLDIQVPNPWRTKAGSKVIRHVPITLYADDTSGNMSKRWNKHISYYFTLSGLPPVLTNMEYHCHFICTSNVAGALELAEPVVQELNQLVNEGHVAYDCGIHQEVLVMSVALCFLADSPMAAEVTNTPLPGGSCNNPCRRCHLGVAEAADRMELPYLKAFFGVHSLPAPRSWRTTVAITKDSWQVYESQNKAAYNTLMGNHALKDKLQEELIELIKNNPSEQARVALIPNHRLCNPIVNLEAFDGACDTPVESLHVILLGVVKYMVNHFMQDRTATELTKMEGYLHSFNTGGLNIPPIQAHYMIKHWGSFVGKDFRTILQVAPFVFFPFMDAQQKEIWIPLCHLGSLVFQTNIPVMDSYLLELSATIKIFTHNILQMSARWSNKPKFHMILHLEESIRRFGPASLFATEKFESFNGILRTEAIHSNRQSPGHDIALSFLDHHVNRLLFSQAYLRDHDAQEYFQASSFVTNVFSENPLMQKAMGYNAASLHQGRYPSIHKAWVDLQDLESVPPELLRAYPKHQYRQLGSLNLNEKEVIKKGSFVLEKSSPIANGGIGCVESIWEVLPVHAYLVKMVDCRLTGTQPTCMMRMLHKENTNQLLHVSKLQCSINVQHNCFDGGCTVSVAHAQRTKRQEGTSVTRLIQHKNTNSFLLNGFSHHEPVYHRYLHGLQPPHVTEHSMVVAANQGHWVWHTYGPPLRAWKDRENKRAKEAAHAARTQSERQQVSQSQASNMASTSQNHI